MYVCLYCGMRSFQWLSFVVLSIKRVCLSFCLSHEKVICLRFQGIISDQSNCLFVFLFLYLTRIVKLRLPCLFQYQLVMSHDFENLAKCFFLPGHHWGKLRTPGWGPCLRRERGRGPTLRRQLLPVCLAPRCLIAFRLGSLDHSGRTNITHELATFKNC